MLDPNSMAGLSDPTMPAEYGTPTASTTGAGALPSTPGYYDNWYTPQAQPAMDTGGGMDWESMMQSLMNPPMNWDARRAQGTAAMASGTAGMAMGAGLAEYGMREGQAMNPFDPMRGYYMKQLQQLSASPTDVAHIPGYQAGLEGVQRSMAAQGYQGSGNMMAELNKYSGGMYNQQMQTLAGFAGANAMPGAGGQLAVQGVQQGMNLMGQGMASQGYGTALMNPIGRG